MKTKLFALAALLTLVIAATSCYSSKKTGCPGNPGTSARFRG